MCRYVRLLAPIIHGVAVWRVERSAGVALIDS